MPKHAAALDISSSEEMRTDKASSAVTGSGGTATMEQQLPADSMGLIDIDGYRRLMKSFMDMVSVVLVLVGKIMFIFPLSCSGGTRRHYSGRRR